jgi:hypothetical protein
MNTLLKAAHAATIKQAAQLYLQAGISVIPVRGKAPCVKWQQYTVRRASRAAVNTWASKGILSGVGIVCGEVSGGLVVIDIDSMAAVDEYETVFPELRHTFTVRSGSGRGRHYYYYADGILPANLWRNGVELRANHAYVVGAPSPHPSGLAYSVVRRHEILRTEQLLAVRRWINERGGSATPQVPTSPTPIRLRSSSYGAKALAGECASVQAAAEGAGNTTLYLAALRCGSLIASGLLSQGEVEAALELAAADLTRRDGIQATRRTIASGLRIGMTSPRTVK